jgi:hypothetical protein
VGVLSGVGHTDDLLPEADHVVRSVKDILPLILPADKWKDFYRYSSDDRILVEPHPESTTAAPLTDSQVALVIFDMNGTLLCTHDRYIEWLNQFCGR